VKETGRSGVKIGIGVKVVVRTITCATREDVNEIELMAMKMDEQLAQTSW